MIRRRTRGEAPANPSKTVAIGFAVMILLGALLLMLPAARVGDGNAPFVKALFTSTSAICVTGLTVVDTATYWTPFGQFIIMGLIQVGGLGIITGASLLFLAVSRRMGLRSRMMAQRERGSVNLGDVKNVVLAVVAFSVIFEIVGAIILTIRFWIDEGRGFGSAVWHGLFHSVSAFNNAGFALFSDNMMGYYDDLTLTVTLGLLVVFGGLGFPVWLELRNRWRTPFRWSLHTKLTLVTTGFLLIGGSLVMLMIEWRNENTLGPMTVSQKAVAAFFTSSVSRTAGFNSIDYGEVHDETMLVTDVLMFIGGGNGSTAGGIKVTTFALLLMMMIAEFRGREDVTAFGRRVAGTIQRQALTIAFATINLVLLGAGLIMWSNEFRFADALFEAVSAAGTVGLSTGITPHLNAFGEFILIGLMYLGRIGPLTLAVALILRQYPKRFRYPEERPLVG